MHRPNYSHAPYLDGIIRTNALRKNIRRAVKILKPIAANFDGVAFRGASGMIPGPVLALQLNKSMILVRKNEKRHSSRDVEGDCGIKSYIIVDDQISTGSTIRDIISKVNEFANHTPRLYGVMLLGCSWDGVDTEFLPITERRVERAYQETIGPIPADWGVYEGV